MPGTPPSPQAVEARTSRRTRWGLRSGQLLGDAAAERDAEHVGVGQAEGVQEVGGLAGEAVWPQRDEPGW